MQNESSRVLLFKMPAGRRNYAQKLLDVLCCPSGSIIKLTTYAEPWVGHEIFENPEQLDGRKALLICVDAQQNEQENFVLKKLYPLREVIIRIKDPAHEGKFLATWVETGGYVEPCNYDDYTSELRNALPILPPQPGSYIQFDQLRNLEITSAEDHDKTLRTWQSLVSQLNGIDTYSNAAFYTIESIRRDKEIVRIQDSTYPLVEGRKYELHLTTFLPSYGVSGGRDSFEIKLESPSLLMSRNRLEFFGKQDTEITALVAKPSVGIGVPFLRIEGSGEQSQTTTTRPGLVPRLELKLKLVKPSLLRRVFDFLTHIIAPVVPFVFVYAIVEWYREAENYRLAGAPASSPMLLIYPVISSLMLLAIPIVIAYSVSRRSV